MVCLVGLIGQSFARFLFCFGNGGLSFFFIVKAEILRSNTYATHGLPMYTFKKIYNLLVFFLNLPAQSRIAMYTEKFDSRLLSKIVQISIQMCQKLL